MLAYYPILVNIDSRGVTGAVALHPGWMALAEQLRRTMA